MTEDVTTPIDVLDNDTDIDGGLMHVVAKSNGVHGDVAITGGGTGVSYDPDLNYVGDDTFTYGLNGGSTATVTVTVGAADDPPVAEDDEFTILEDATLQTFDVLDNDTDIDAGPMTVISVTDPPKGTASLAPGGAGVRYIPTANANGDDEFDLRAERRIDGDRDCPHHAGRRPTRGRGRHLHGRRGSTQSGVARCPAERHRHRRRPEDHRGRDERIEGHGGHRGGGTSLTYMPAANATGADTFTYTLNGGSVASVNITITPSNDLPVAGADSLSLPAGAAAVPVPGPRE